MSGSRLELSTDASRGRILGKYEILCRLSTGGMAEIFLAAQHGLAGFRKMVVLKQILPDIRGEEEFVRMFLNEARITSAFNHPNIAQVFDLDVAQGELFLTMEFVPGATLVDVAKACRANNEPIPMGFALSAVRDTALALNYAHHFVDPTGRPTSVIHRDVAEKNIMVTYEGVTKLLDFGIAKNLGLASRTSVGTVKGTSGYMSPEQIQGERLDARSDLFSLGVVLHECLTGLRLFFGKTAEEGMNATLYAEAPPPSRINKRVPPSLDAIVLKALSKKREDRYSTTLEFARAIERAVGHALWRTEQSGEFIRHLFADRREQSHQLMASLQNNASEFTGEIRLAPLFPGSFPPPGSGSSPIDEGPFTQRRPPLPQDPRKPETVVARTGALHGGPGEMAPEPKTVQATGFPFDVEDPGTRPQVLREAPEMDDLWDALDRGELPPRQERDVTIRRYMHPQVDTPVPQYRLRRPLSAGTVAGGLVLVLGVLAIAAMVIFSRWRAAQDAPPPEPVLLPELQKKVELPPEEEPEALVPPEAVAEDAGEQGAVDAGEADAGVAAAEAPPPDIEASPPEIEEEKPVEKPAPAPVPSRAPRKKAKRSAANRGR